MMGKYKILIPDGEVNLVIKVLRSLLEVSGISVYIMSTERCLGIRYSRIVRYFEYDPGFRETDTWINRINNLMTTYDIDVLMPVHLNAIRRLLECRDQLRYPGRTLLPPSLQIFTIAEEKQLLAEHMKRIGIPHPASWPLHLSDGNRSALDSLKYPLLMKPTLGLGGGIGIKRFENARELRESLEANPPQEEVMLQEFVPGTDLGFNVLCLDGEILAYSIQIGTLFHSEDYRPQIGLKMIDNESIYQSMACLLKSLRWNGVAHIDLIYNPNNGDFKVLEMNPRFWLTLHASAMAGVNFPWLYCQAVIGNKLPAPSYAKDDFLELAGLRKWLKENPLRLFRLRFIFLKTPVKALLMDPLIIPCQWYYNWRSKSGDRA